MKHKTIEVLLGSEVADAGTVAVNYPAGFSDGDFENGVGHYLSLNGAKLSQPEKIGLSFGDTAVTITNRTGDAWPAGSRGYLQLNLPGKEAGLFYADPASGDVAKRLNAQKLHPLLLNLGAPVVADADGIAASQSVAAAASFTLDGALAPTSGSFILDVPRNVVAAWTTTAVLTITGKDLYGRTMVEVSASGTSHTGKKAFKEITSVSSSASITSATVGTGDVLGLPVRVETAAHVVKEFVDGVEQAKKPSYVRLPFSLLEAEADAGTLAYIFPGFAGEIVDAGVAIGDTVTTGGALTFAVGATAVDGLTLTVADGATAGVVYSDTPTAGHASISFAATDFISVTPAAAINASGRMVGWIGVRPTAPLMGTLVAGLTKDTKSTGTTADVLGTYDPVAACDGTKNFMLSVLVSDPDYLGKQYAG